MTEADQARSQGPRHGHADCSANADSRDRQRKSLSQHHPQYIGAMRSNGHANADFTRASCH